MKVTLRYFETNKMEKPPVDFSKMILKEISQAKENNSKQKHKI